MTHSPQDIDNLQRSLLNSFTDSGLDRASLKRKDPEWLKLAIHRPGSRLIFFDGDRCLVDDSGQIMFSTRSTGRILDADIAPVFLGLDDEGPLFALDASVVQPQVDEFTNFGQFHELRAFSRHLSASEAARLAYAKAILIWHRRHRYCGSCGTSTDMEEGGHIRRCGNNQCGLVHFPRTDPAIIVRVTCGERVLLGRSPKWAPNRYSVLAGFVEPGETLEHAVVREVFEETGVRVDRAFYHSSQPWPFPASVMIGYGATTREQSLALDHDEIEDAVWLSRHELDEAMASRQVIVSPPLSIAFRLLEDWYNQHGGDLRKTVRRTRTEST